jgi:selenocysteine lyase/cysteine desulfurase
MTDWSAIRSEFPALAKWTYLNTAAFGQVPRRATRAMAAHMERRDQTACADFLHWYDDADRIRAQCAQLIHAEPDDITFVPNASAGLALLIQGLSWAAGDEVLTIEDEFPNQLYVSAALDRFGAVHRVVPWKDFYSSVSGRTRLVVLSAVNYATGFRLPLDEISRFLAERGVLFYLDGTQSVGALEFDVRRVLPSVLCVDAYKWMLSPNGAGFAYVAPELRERLAVTVVGWRTDRDWREVGHLNHGAPLLGDAAEKYEGGALVFPSLYAMNASLDMMLEIGASVIEARVLHLAGQVRAMLRGLGASVNDDASQIVTACMPGLEPGELVPRLREEHILVSARHGRLRVSPHFYNDEGDVEKLRLALK